MSTKRKPRKKTLTIMDKFKAEAAKEAKSLIGAGFKKIKAEVQKMAKKKDTVESSPQRSYHDLKKLCLCLEKDIKCTSNFNPTVVDGVVVCPAKL